MQRAIVFLFLMMCASSCYAVSSVDVSIGQIEYEAGKAENVQIKIDLRNTEQPTATINTQLQLNEDAPVIHAYLDCAIPQQAKQTSWVCQQGLIKSALMHIPFSVTITPKTKGLTAHMHLKEANFSDAAGLHAAEKLTGDLALTVAMDDNGFHWQNDLQWTGGEMFWQPFFLKGGGHSFVATGVFDGENLQFESASLNMHEVGELKFKGNMALVNKTITELEADLPHLDLAKAYPILFQPLLENTAFNHAQMAGVVGLQVVIKASELSSLDIKLSDIDIEDTNKKFAFYKLNAHIPWDYDHPKQIKLNYQRGQLLNLPLGEAHVQAEVNRYAWTASKITLPVLDGALNLSNISAARIGGHWYWHLGADVTPINMVDFSRSLALPIMQGQVSANIPQVTYSGGILTTTGAMQFNVFDGKATVTDLVLFRPLSNIPKLHANVHLRALDLGKLTSTFSFGSIEGRLDGDVDELVMQNWKPIKFDARVESSPGRYRKKISQRAVENISALGGAGAAAAVQRSVLRFFENFNYKRIRLSCMLSNNICQMNGIPSTEGGYTIVEGSGIPAITVKGFNTAVAWSELLSRIKRVTDENTKAIVE